MNCCYKVLKNEMNWIYYFPQDSTLKIFSFLAEKNRYCQPKFTYLSSESPAKSRNSQITASGDRRTANDFK